MGNSVGNKSSVARSSSSVQGNFRPICSDIANVTTTTTDRIASESTVLHRLLTKQSLNWLDSEVQSLFLPEFPLTCSNTKDFLPAAPKANDLVAVGAFGKVFKVDCFALKVIDKSKILEEDLVKQVKQELQILKIIAHHPFVVKFIDCWQSQKELFIVTEFIVNGELLTLLKSFTRFPIEVVKVYLIQLALVLDFLHNAGIIYRDLKAENVLLDSDFNVRLIDFGLSKWLPYGRTAGTVCGTAQYIGNTASKSLKLVI